VEGSGKDLEESSRNFRERNNIAFVRIDDGTKTFAWTFGEQDVGCPGDQLEPRGVIGKP